MFLVFGVLNTKHLSFRTPDASNLIGLIRIFYFLLNFFFLVKFLCLIIDNWARLIKRESKFLEEGSAALEIK